MIGCLVHLPPYPSPYAHPPGALIAHEQSLPKASAAEASELLVCFEGVALEEDVGNLSFGCVQSGGFLWLVAPSGSSSYWDPLAHKTTTHEFHGAVIGEELLDTDAPVLPGPQGSPGGLGPAQVADPRVHLLQGLKRPGAHQDVQAVQAERPGGRR